LFPIDFVDPKTKAALWSGAKRPPEPIVFDGNNELHLTFVEAATYMHAWNLRIIDTEFKPKTPAELSAKRHLIKEIASKVPPAEFKPKSNIKIATDENETAAPGSDIFTDEDEQVSQTILKVLPIGETLKARKLNVVDFEKDDDNNYHIDLIHSASNLRASQYKIQTVDRLQSKLIAGKIIPAIVTTTASITGLVCLDFYKLLQSKPITAYRNSFVNLALPVFQQSEPLPPKKYKFLGEEKTLWDRLELQGDLTLGDALLQIKDKYKLEVDVLGVGSALLYSSWMAKQKQTERKATKLSELVPQVSNVPLKSTQRHLSLEVTGTVNGEDVEVPPVVLFFR